ncbi:hypothetical protein ACFO1B_21945 [Dactylosporangium siamense]|uniref:YtxH domain-containing protein n=1 Tax=Dactylosporangium siamense TaxID=685454 RepID=A0A919UC75_9ACTN|nr:hypothetical protein [Dactylosporangium siamense]GIG50052.1 hypothetical protein Dsi01nite_080930 [Dactylosporangium siamense]
MRLLTLAAGLATGYVLGTRAGRGKYEQIVEGARQLRANPTLAQAQATAKHLATAPGEPVPATPAAITRPAATKTANPATANPPTATPATATPATAAPKAPRRSTATPATLADPLR